MKLFLIEPLDSTRPNHSHGFVVAAEDYTLARSIAARNHKAEGRDFWFDSSLSKCMVIAEDTWLEECLVCEILR